MLMKTSRNWSTVSADIPGPARTDQFHHRLGLRQHPAAVLGPFAGDGRIHDADLAEAGLDLLGDRLLEPDVDDHGV
jgi:hypothetical protein